MVTKKTYTDKQGQYLAFIYYYTKVNGRAPAEADMQRYFRVTPPSVHQMVLTLERAHLIADNAASHAASNCSSIPKPCLPYKTKPSKPLCRGTSPDAHDNRHR